MRSHGPVPRLERPDPDAFHREFVRPGRPAVLAGVADRWRACVLWSPEYFARLLPDLEVRVEVWEGDPSRNDPSDYIRSARPRKMRLGEFCAAASGGATGRKLYLAQCPILTSAPRLREEIDPPVAYMRVPRLAPPLLVRKIRMDPLLWLGPAGVVTTAHFDLAHNLFAQIRGVKKVLLFPPEQSPLLYYPHDAFERNIHFSPVDVEQPDLAAFPRFAEARPLEVTVRAGEILFIPVMWWHHLRALEASVSLNFWWTPPSVIPRAAPHLLREWRLRLRRRLRGARPGPAPGPAA
jgi:hypothetical protein